MANMGVTYLDAITYKQIKFSVGKDNKGFFTYNLALPDEDKIHFDLFIDCLLWIKYMVDEFIDDNGEWIVQG